MSDHVVGLGAHDLLAKCHRMEKNHFFVKKLSRMRKVANQLIFCFKGTRSRFHCFNWKMVAQKHCWWMAIVHREKKGPLLEAWVHEEARNGVEENCLGVRGQTKVCQRSVVRE